MLPQNYHVCVPAARENVLNQSGAATHVESAKRKTVFAPENGRGLSRCLSAAPAHIKHQPCNDRSRVKLQGFGTVFRHHTGHGGGLIQCPTSNSILWSIVGRSWRCQNKIELQRHLHQRDPLCLGRCGIGLFSYSSHLLHATSRNNNEQAESRRKISTKKRDDGWISS